MTNKGMILNLQQAFNTLMGYSAVFCGEKHDSHVVHEGQLIILTELTGRDSNFVLALEIFERDVQDTLNAYLEGTIAEDRSS